MVNDLNHKIEREPKMEWVTTYNCTESEHRSQNYTHTKASGGTKIKNSNMAGVVEGMA